MKLIGCSGEANGSVELSKWDNEISKNLLKQFIKEGRFEFVNGGWSMHDEDYE